MIEKVTLGYEDKECSQKIVEATCYYNFPLCSTYNGVEVPQKLCREDCEILTRERCREQFNSIVNVMDQRESLLTPSSFHLTTREATDIYDVPATLTCSPS